MDWNTIGAVGRLQVLSRASVVMLAIVPLLAAVWPTVRAVSNQYNFAVEEATDRLNQATERLKGTLERIEHTGKTDKEIVEEIQLQAHLIKNSANTWTSDFASRTIDSTHLPHSWAVAFFAAFFVVLGRTLFQTCCPKEVQDHSEDQFINAAASKFLQAPSIEAITEALVELEAGTEPDLREHFFDPKKREHRVKHGLLCDEYSAPDFRDKRLQDLLRTHSSLKKQIEEYFGYANIRVVIPPPEEITRIRLDQWSKLAESKEEACTSEIREGLQDLERVSYKIRLLSEHSGANETASMATHRRSTIIQRAAAKQFKRLASERPNWRAVCAFSYSIAILLIVWIILTQVLAVGEAAGFWPLNFMNLITQIYWFIAGMMFGLPLVLLLLALVVVLATWFTSVKKRFTARK